MHLVTAFFIRVLETMFIAGLLGSAVVIVLTGIEDIETVLEGDESAPPAELPAS